MSEQLHSDTVLIAEGCLSCHADYGPAEAGLDLVELGYSDDRIERLQNMDLAQMAEQIRQGQPWYLPDMMLPDVRQ